MNNRISDLNSEIEANSKTITDLKSQTARLNSLVKIGEASLKEEQEVVRELQKKIADQKTITAAAANGTSSNDAIENLN